MGSYQPLNALLQSAQSVAYDRLRLPHCQARGVEVLLRRDDLLHPIYGGNKLFKLYFNLAQARQLGKTRLVSLGGPWSNHLHTLARMASEHGFAAKAIVRGERPAQLSATLLDAQRWGMELQFVSRRAYRAYAAGASLEIADDDYFVPEGGANELGRLGCEWLGQAIALSASGNAAAICLPVGTGATMAGVIRGLAGALPTIGFSALKDDSAQSQIAMGLPTDRPWRLIWGFHGGGYGRRLPSAMMDFWRRFEREHTIALDPVYTLKMLWGINQLALAGYWRPGTTLIALHTGGIQGRRGFSAQIDWPRPSPLSPCEQ